jgi:Family of unknown function (DUF5677)
MMLRDPTVRDIHLQDLFITNTYRGKEHALVSWHQRWRDKRSTKSFMRQTARLTRHTRRLNVKEERRNQKLCNIAWGGAFKLFRQTYLLAQAVGAVSEASALLPHDAVVCKSHSSALPDSTCDHYIAKNVLQAILAKVCVIDQMIDHAISRGYATESSILVRSLYEASICATIIARDSTHQLAVRYHDSAVVKEANYYRMRSLWLDAPQWSRPSDEYLHELEASSRAVVDRWKRIDFGNYEWARPAVDVRARGKVRFEDLEGAAGLRHRAPLYRLLSEKLHLSPLDILSDWKTQSTANYGFAAATDSHGLFGALPEILIASSLMTNEVSLVVSQLCATTSSAAHVSYLQERVDLYASALAEVIRDGHIVFERVMGSEYGYED